ncbi:MAG: carboxymuconolactone decarboxylase family protein [Bryobacteraceae bacterium]
MQRITAVNPAEATGKTKQLLDGVQTKMGMTPNMMRTMAAAPTVLDGYLHFAGALGTGHLDAKFRQEIALAVGQANSCEYCLSAHTAIGKMVGLNAEELASGREAHSKDAKRNAGLQFVQALVLQRGVVSDQAIADVKAAGFNEGDIAEIVANVALNVFTNYFNLVARTEVDFPRVPVALEKSAA